MKIIFQQSVGNNLEYIYSSGPNKIRIRVDEHSTYHQTKITVEIWSFVGWLEITCWYMKKNEYLEDRQKYIQEAVLLAQQFIDESQDWMK